MKASLVVPQNWRLELPIIQVSCPCISTRRMMAAHRGANGCPIQNSHVIGSAKYLSTDEQMKQMCYIDRWNITYPRRMNHTISRNLNRARNCNLQRKPNTDKSHMLSLIVETSGEGSWRMETIKRAHRKTRGWWVWERVGQLWNYIISLCEKCDNKTHYFV